MVLIPSHFVNAMSPFMPLFLQLRPQRASFLKGRPLWSKTLVLGRERDENGYGSCISGSKISHIYHSMASIGGLKMKGSFRTRASSLYSSSPSSNSRKLVLYSKPGCCLCDGLKEKLQAALTLSGPHSINDVELQIRDITTNPEWEKAFQYEIPVSARVRSDGTEEILHRLSPRLGVELMQKKISAALSE